ncbi:MAG: DUF6476 family protein [Roseobacter sp.]
MENPNFDPDEKTELPAHLVFLRRLVTVLTATMVAGVLMIIVLLVMRFYDVEPVLPETLILPDGAKAVSFTQGPKWYAVVTDTNQIHIFDRVTGKLTKSIDVE